MKGINFRIYNAFNPIPSFEKQTLIEFIHKNYKEQSSLLNIKKSVAYAIKDRFIINSSYSHGGVIILACDKSDIVGGLVLNKTGLDEIYPENIIMYIATETSYRMNGIARKMIQLAREFSNGGITIYIHPNNPNSQFLSKSGFNNSMLQMKLV
jgi:[ribosomal protein S18]-alanine N-acetyltransferase